MSCDRAEITAKQALGKEVIHIMRKSRIFLGLLFIFVFVFSLAFTSANKATAGLDYCCAVEDPITHEINRGYWVPATQTCNCIYNPAYYHCTFYCASSGG
jgi:hypothetical protein